MAHVIEGFHLFKWPQVLRLMAPVCLGRAEDTFLPHPHLFCLSSQKSVNSKHSSSQIGSFQDSQTSLRMRIHLEILIKQFLGLLPTEILIM